MVLDAGHGGEDPGAVGAAKTLEKHLVLKIAKQLQKELNKVKGIRAELTRKGDYYIPLRKRRKIAADLNADLFVSIHADAFTKRSANGISVFALSSTVQPANGHEYWHRKKTPLTSSPVKTYLKKTVMSPKRLLIFRIRARLVAVLHWVRWYAPDFQELADCTDTVWNKRDLQCLKHQTFRLYWLKSDLSPTRKRNVA